MAKKKPAAAAANARGFATTSTPSKKQVAAAAAAVVEEEAAPAPLVRNPVAPPKPKKKDLKAAKAAEKAAASADDAVSKHLADFARDARVARIGTEITKLRDDASANAVPVALPVRCERMLVDYLVTKIPETLGLGNGGEPAPAPPRLRVPTEDVSKLMRDLHLVHVTLEQHLGLDRAIVHAAMKRAPAPWDVQNVAHTVCLTVSGERLPRGFADKVYYHQGLPEPTPAEKAAAEAEEAAKKAAKGKGRARGRGGKGGDAAAKSAAAAGGSASPKSDAAKPAAAPAAAAASDGAAAASSPKKPAKSTAEDLGIDLDSLNVFDLDHSDVPSTYKTPEAREFSTIGWTGKVPKQLLRDTMFKEDRNVKIGYPDAKRERGVPIPSGTCFRVQCNINGKSWKGPDYCKTKLEAEHYAATIGLYFISKGRPLGRMLPPAYREVWNEVEARDKGQAEEGQRKVDSEMVQFLVDLVAQFKAEGAMGPKKATAGSDSRSGTPAPDATASTASASRTGNGRNVNTSTPLPTRDPALQRQRETLPVWEYRAEVAAAVRNHRVVIVSGETGSGKSTQVPQFVLEDVVAAGEAGQIFCCQPRRISATSIATRVAKEWGDARVGDTVGYSVKLESKQSARTRLVFCTTGILLRRLESDPVLDGISHVILDEVHERSLDSDFLLVMLKRLLDARPDLKVVLMSATMKDAEFAAYLGGCPVLAIPGRTFPVDRLYLEDVIEATRYTPQSDEFLRDVRVVKKKTMTGATQFYWEEQPATFPEDTSPYLAAYPHPVKAAVRALDPTVINYELIVRTVHHIMEGSYDEGEGDSTSGDARLSSGPRDLGAILVFLPGIGEIRRLYDRLKDVPGASVLPLHSSLSPAQQAQVFRPPLRGMRKIVLSTNIAETGVTIPDVVFVIDSGKAKITRYDEKKHVTRLRESFVTQANCRQRQGRAGRVRAGYYFAMYSRHRHDHLMAEYEVPEIQRMALESTALKIKVYGLPDIVDAFRAFLDPPPTSRVIAAIDRLKATRALDDDGELTPLGRFLGLMPLDVELGKLLAFGAFYGCIDVAVTVAAYLSASVQLFESTNWQGGGGGGAGSLTRDLLYGRSDLLTYYNIYTEWKTKLRKEGASKARAYCTRHGLNYKSLTIVDDTRTQLISLLPLDWDACNKHNSCLDIVHLALLAAAYPNVMKLHEGAFTSARGTVTLHGGSIFVGETAAAVLASVKEAGLLIAGVQVSSAMAATAATASRELSPFYCYFTCLHSTQLLVFDATNVHPLLVTFAVGCQYPLATNYLARTVTLDRDGVAKVRLPPKTAAHLREFHGLLTTAFETFLLNPSRRAPAVDDVLAQLHAIL
ncbi:hypothetical protein H9P43_009556 [Blastocladiella emersonii ATCC 22665]|nr:hypothetical protein H9P43_009556 [Blastocladiella emersonii ATCC 22665]